MRNGYSPATVKTTAGPVTVARPKLRGTTAAFASKLFGSTVTRSNALESLVIAGFVRGLSVRDVENTLADALGSEAALSKSTVSRVCQAIGEQFEAWRTRPLDGVVLDYLFLDASMFRMHPGARAEPVLAAWGIDTGGKPVFVALAAGGSESADAWGDFLDELAGRGLRPPLLVISDGAAGLISAAESVLARSLRQRCLIHRCRNVLAKVPATAQEEIRGAYWAIFDTAALTGAGVAPGQRLVTAVQARIDSFAQKYATLYPAAVRCLLADCEQLTSYLRFPVEHHKRIRHSNFIERTFGETRRRVKVIGRLRVADQPAGDGDQPPAQGGDHGLAAADAVTGQDGRAPGGGGELVQPRGDAGRQQRPPHPGGINCRVTRREVPEGGTVLAVTENALDRGPVPVPVLGRGGLARRGHVPAGQDERVRVDRLSVFQPGDREGALGGVQGPAPP